MPVFKPSNLQQRTALFILAPTLIILLTIGVLGFNSIEKMLIDQVTLSANSQLQRTASYIDTYLKRPKIILSKLETAPSDEINEYLLSVLGSLEGIINVQYSALQEETDQRYPVTDTNQKADNSLHFPTQSTYLPSLAKHTISLISKKRDSSGKVIGQFEVTIAFYDLIGHIPSAPWWTGLHTFMIDPQGNILAPDSSTTDGFQKSSIYHLNHVEGLKEKLLSAIRENTSGAVFSDNARIPVTIYGFYSLSEAPWTMVVSSTGESILSHVTAFRHAYFFTVFLTILIILFLLRCVTARTITAVKKVSAAATRLAKGHFDAPLHVESMDELGELVQSFNSMSRQLQQGIQLKNAMALAGEVQRNLLPETRFKSEHLEAIGISIPSDETGGDFFDLMDFKANDHRLTLVVGDVVGHGIGAALLMATTRALIRSRIGQPGTLAHCISDVNSLLCRDTEASGNFVTVFMLGINGNNNTINWIRAGHEPAIVYNLKENTFSELRGEGVALGIDRKRQYTESHTTLPNDPHIILIGTDGMTDAENTRGERFGKKRIQSLIARHSERSPEAILKALCDELEKFRDKQRQNDDITFVIVKTC